jgi:hypothetical protein
LASNTPARKTIHFAFENTNKNDHTRNSGVKENEGGVALAW